ncbi:four helix bundle protein [bacterium]|nr:four helix bundle protein [bacterium]
MTIKSHRDLIVWQKSMDLVDEIYTLTRQFPVNERLGLISQIRRAAVSVPSNLAEGHSRGSRRDYTQFVSIAKGSLMELQTQLLIAMRQEFCAKSDVQNALRSLGEIERMLTALRKKLAAEL